MWNQVKSRGTCHVTGKWWWWEYWPLPVRNSILLQEKNQKSLSNNHHRVRVLNFPCLWSFCAPHNWINLRFGILNYRLDCTLAARCLASAIYWAVERRTIRFQDGARNSCQLKFNSPNHKQFSCQAQMEIFTIGFVGVTTASHCLYCIVVSMVTIDTHLFVVKWIFLTKFLLVKYLLKSFLKNVVGYKQNCLDKFQLSIPRRYIKWEGKVSCNNSRYAHADLWCETTCPAKRCILKYLDDPKNTFQFSTGVRKWYNGDLEYSDGYFGNHSKKQKTNKIKTHSPAISPENVNYLSLSFPESLSLTLSYTPHVGHWITNTPKANNVRVNHL